MMPRRIVVERERILCVVVGERVGPSQGKAGRSRRERVDVDETESTCEGEREKVSMFGEK
jgi:hypothetical protein